MLLDIGLNVLLGLALGTLGGLFGIGGGLIAIPVLGVLFGLDQQLAQGTALVMVVPNVLLAIWRYHQRNRIDWRTRRRWPAPASSSRSSVPLWRCRWTPGACAWPSSAFSWRWQPTRCCACFCARRLEMVSCVIPGHGSACSRCGAGAAGGLFGVGGAVIATPILTSVFGTSQVVAQGLSLALAAPSTGVTLVTYALHQQVNWLLGLPLAVGGLLSISLGVRLAHALPERLLRLLFSGFLVASAVLLAMES